MKALLTNYHQSPRKVRLVADMIRGKSVMDAKAALTFLPKKSSPDMLKLLNSAIANAREQGASPKQLFIKMIQVNKGGVMRRFMPKARGRAGQIRKTMSIISLELGERSAPKQAKAKVVEPKTTTEKKTRATSKKKEATK